MIMDQEQEDITRIVAQLAGNPKVIVKSQQRGEPELSSSEKEEILLEIIKKKSNSQFLSQFGKYLSPDNIKYFDSKSYDDPDEQFCVNFHCKHLKEAASKQKSIVKNRRFQALKKMIETRDSHFSELELMQRWPLLYEEMVGQYMSEEEKRNRDQSEGPSFAMALMKGIELDEIRSKRQAMEVENQFIKNDQYSSDEDISSGFESINMEEEQKPSKSLWGEFDEMPREARKIKLSTPTVKEEDKNQLKQEFMDIIYLKFLSGDDPDFDYFIVDNDENYDDLETQAQDEEDKYFDEEENN